MNVITPLDEKATIANVRRFFSKDFPRLQVIAHISYVDIKTPVLSGMPANHSVTNANVDKFTSHAQANVLLEQIVDACSGLDEMPRKVLDLRYFKGMTWLQITERLGYSTRRCQQLLSIALLDFAIAFQDVEDFRVLQ
ncbi:ArpU family phage packaging/lysis transcriptional regulator [Pediococcus pentosaceus]|uniref:ArpU family phage packaging/lysis transcriptional regulator n=1 Tax=Pediococcus pentosaceus TaxID=1255 RepID=UPI003982D6D9